MRYFKRILKKNLLLKITSLNALVISIRLIISLIVQRILAITVGEIGISKIGQLRNLIQIITSTASLGSFNGVVKYVAEFKDDNKWIQNVFTTTFSFVFIGSIITSIIGFIFSSQITIKLFGDLEFLNVIRLLALLPLIIGVNRVLYGVINGLSEYKKYAKVDLVSYVLSIVLLSGGLYFYGLKGVLYSIVVTPVIQLSVIIYVFGSRVKELVKLKSLKLKVPLGKEILTFTIMSFFSTVLLNYVELDIRTIITNQININEAGYWTAMNFVSKNYMVFSSSLFTLYVIPKFTRIYSGELFFKETLNIYKTIMPLFGIGMILVYVFREWVVDIVYPNFTGLEPLFKWQLAGDFIRLLALVLAHQFLAKKMIKSFVITELVSLVLFYFLAKELVVQYGAEGVVMAHFYRYIVYFGVVVFAIWNYFKKEQSF